MARDREFGLHPILHAREPTIVSECGNPDVERAFLQAIFSTIFEDQLDCWWPDWSMWPTPRSSASSHAGVIAVSFELLDLTDERLAEEEV